MKFIGLPKDYKRPGEGFRTVLGVSLLLALAFVSILGADAMFSNPRPEPNENVAGTGESVISAQTSDITLSNAGGSADIPSTSTGPVDPETPVETTPEAALTPTATPAPTEVTIRETKESATYYATGDINVRSGPGTDYEIVDSLSKGDKIQVVAYTENGWKKISEGHYVIDDFVSENAPETPKSGTYYTIGEVNVRSGPGTDYSITKTLGKNSPVDVVAITANGWYRTVVDTYVLADLCTSDTPATPTPKPTATPKATPTPKPIPEGTEEQAALVNLSVDDFLLMAGIVESERPSGNGMYDGQLWVAQVIWNRVNSSKWPNTVFEVITQTNQFSTDVYNSETKEYTSLRAPKESSRRAVVEAFQNPPIPTNVIFFNQASHPDTEKWMDIWVYYGDCDGNSFFLYERVN
ncbi:MAG: SH3 domain-containing protein [Clostridiales bacterium]|nr:SH3 domain-containing protein [Clostridiales bacterium]